MLHSRRATLVLPTLLVGCASRPTLEGRIADASVDFDAADSLEVVLDDHSFAPSTLRLHPDAPVRLVLVNRGAKPHDFTAPAFFRTVATRAGDPVAGAMRAAGGRVDIPAGETRTLPLLPLTAGRFPLECVKPLHALLGMEGEIVVAA